MLRCYKSQTSSVHAWIHLFFYGNSIWTIFYFSIRYELLNPHLIKLKNHISNKKKRKVVKPVEINQTLSLTPKVKTKTITIKDWNSRESHAKHTNLITYQRNNNWEVWNDCIIIQIIKKRKYQNKHFHTPIYHFKNLSSKKYKFFI